MSESVSDESSIEVGVWKKFDFVEDTKMARPRIRINPNNEDEELHASQELETAIQNWFV